MLDFGVEESSSSDQTSGSTAVPIVMPILPGYTMIALLGRGAAGSVWHAHDDALDRDVAIKLIEIASGDENSASRVMREARAAARLNHPNAVTLYHVSREGDRICIFMELLDGGSLADLLDCEGRFDWPNATRAIRDAAAGLGAAHAAGLVHRDVKPSNLLIDASGRVKVADFGVVQAGGLATRLTSAGAMIGTPNYMAPEQCRGETADARSDLYALGCTWFHLLTGRPPFQGDGATAVLYQHCHEPLPSAMELAPDLPAGVIAVLEKLTRKSPGDRYASAEELIADLDRLLVSEGKAAARDAIFPKATGGKSPARWALAVAAILALLAASGWSLWRGLHRSRSASDRPLAQAELTAHSAPAARLVLRGGKYAVSDVGFSPDGRFVWATGHEPRTGYGSEARRWEVSTGANGGQNLAQAQAVVSPAGDLVLGGRLEGGIAQGFDAPGPLCEWQGHSTPFAISSDDRLMVSGEQGGDGHLQLIVRSLPAGERSFVVDPSNDPRAAAFTPDGRYLIFDDHYGWEVRVWDMAAHRELWKDEFQISGGVVFGFSADGSKFLRWSTGEGDRDVARVYGTATGRIWALIQPGGEFTAAAIAPNGRFVLFAAANRRESPRMWDIESDHEVTAFTPRLPPVSTLAICPDSTRALAGCEDGTLCLLALPGGSEIGRMSRHQGKVTAIAFSSSGRLAASGSEDKTVRVWQLP